MTIKIQCSCGVKFAFDAVEGSPLPDGSIRCPNCGTDGTPIANSVLGVQAAAPAPSPQLSRPGLSVSRAESSEKPFSPVTEEAAAGADGETPAPMKRSEKLRKQAEEETGALNKILLTVAACLALVVGAWAYYTFSLSRPSQIYQSPMALDAKAWLVSETRLLIVETTKARLIEIPADREVWSTPIPKQGIESANKADAFEDNGFGRGMEAELDKGMLTIRDSKGVTVIDVADGSIKSQVPLRVFGQRAITKAAVYALAGNTPDARLLIHQPLDGGTVSTQAWTLPKWGTPAAVAKPSAEPVRLSPRPANASTVDWGMATNKRPFTMVEFFSAPDHLIELKSELLEHTKVPRGQPMPNTAPALTSTLNAAGSMEAVMALGREMSSRQKEEWDDISKIRVTLTRHFGSAAPVWSSEVAGPATLFPMADFDLLVAGSDIVCLTRDNTIKWQAKLPGYLPPWAMRSASYLDVIRNRVSSETYDRPDGPEVWFLGLNGPAEQERAGRRATAPVFTQIGNKILAVDRGNIALLEMETGTVKWRVSSAGTISVQPDGLGSLYVSAMSSDPYAETGGSFAEVKNFIIKVDLETGAKKWTMSEEGLDVVISGKYIYAAAVGESVFAKSGSLDKTRTAVARLRPSNGSHKWVQSIEGSAHGIDAVGRTILLQMKSSAEVYRYWDF